MVEGEPPDHFDHQERVPVEVTFWVNVLDSDNGPAVHFVDPYTGGEGFAEVPARKERDDLRDAIYVAAKDAGLSVDAATDFADHAIIDVWEKFDG